MKDSAQQEQAVPALSDEKINALKAPYIASNRWVVKIGSAMITNDGAGIDRERIKAWVADMAEMHKQGKEMLVVSSGAVAVGLQKLGWEARPKKLRELQAAAAVGQMGLMEAWESAFHQHGIKTAQVLITHDDCADRKRYLNIRMALRVLLENRVIPIVNENDTLAYNEIRFGDNDSIGAWMSNLIEAGTYVILTDQQGLYTANPSIDTNAKLIHLADAEDNRLLDMASGGGGRLGSGGMTTKLIAAHRAAQSGTATIIAPGNVERVIHRLEAGELIGTFLEPPKTKRVARKQWLNVQLQVMGSVQIDEGAAKALVQEGKSLLPVGVKSVSGDFQRGDLISINDLKGQELARGIANYRADAAREIMGRTSRDIHDILGYQHADSLVHRDNLVLAYSYNEKPAAKATTE